MEGKLEMCVGIRDRGWLGRKIAKHLPLIGGERALRRRVFEDIPDEFLKGFMVESYLLEGAQDPSGNEFGKSITDPCLGWEDSERFVLELADCALRQ